MSHCEFTTNFKMGEICLPDYHGIQPTLKYLINEHARLTIFMFFSTLLALIRSCLLNYFVRYFYPARLLHPALS